jgi:hypothetical protein
MESTRWIQIQIQMTLLPHFPSLDCRRRSVCWSGKPLVNLNISSSDSSKVVDHLPTYQSTHLSHTMIPNRPSLCKYATNHGSSPYNATGRGISGGISMTEWRDPRLSCGTQYVILSFYPSNSRHINSMSSKSRVTSS